VRIVLDSNVLMSGVFFGGVPGRILEAWRAGRVSIVVSPAILAEYRRIGAALAESYPLIDFEPFAALIAVHAEIVQAPDHLDPAVCSDSDDDKFLACALAANSELIVSGDKALFAVSGWRGIEVLRPRTFVERYLSE
jgi:uncharacterized protein